MRNKAPEGQPTSSIKRMMDHAEKELRHWERVERTAGETLRTANQQEVYWSKELSRLRRQHDERIAEGRDD